MRAAAKARTLLRGIVARPRGYDLAQTLVLYPVLARSIRRQLAATAPTVVLDAGAGTGGLISLLPSGCRYIALDVDEQKLRRAGERNARTERLLGSITEIPLADDSADVVTCVNVSHHLDDAELRQGLAELARVASRAIVFVDAVDAPRLLSRMLWSVDRGSHPRSEERLLSLIRERFDLDAVERLTLVHRYVICRGRPCS